MGKKDPGRTYQPFIPVRSKLELLGRGAASAPFPIAIAFQAPAGILSFGGFSEEAPPLAAIPGCSGFATFLGFASFAVTGGNGSGGGNGPTKALLISRALSIRSLRKVFSCSAYLAASSDAIVTFGEPVPGGEGQNSKDAGIDD